MQSASRQRKQVIGLLVATYLFGFGFIFLNWFDQQHLIQKPFRGFFTSESLRASEIRLPGWAAFATQIAPGDRIVALNGNPISSVEELQTIERDLDSAESVDYTFERLNRERFTVPLKQTNYQANDVMLTFGVFAISALAILVMLTPAILVGQERWRFPLWLYAFCGSTWLVGSCDYYSQYVFSEITILAGGFLGAVSVHFVTVVLNDALKKTHRFVIGSAYFVCLALTVIHLSLYQSASRFEVVSLFLLLWGNGTLFSVVIAAIAIHTLRRERAGTSLAIRAWVLLVTYSMFLGLPIILMTIGFALGVKPPVNQFTVLIPIFPLSVLFLCIADLHSRTIKELQKKLTDREKFSALNILTAGLAHEIKNPLHIICMNNQILRDSVTQFVRKKSTITRRKIDSSLGAIHHSVERIVNIIDSIVAFSRGSLSVHTHVEMRSTVSRAINQLNEIIKSKNIEVVLEMEDTVPIRIAPGAVHHILLNLIRNACEAVDKNGKIVIAAKIAGESLTIIVSDNGRGISLEAMPFIFDPFFTTKDVGQGMGLGLWIVRQTAAVHGGTAEVLETGSEGTRFRVTLPIEQSVVFENPLRQGDAGMRASA